MVDTEEKFKEMVFDMRVGIIARTKSRNIT
jgi:hypothetical protein